MDYLTVSFDELKEKDFSLNFKDYIKQNIKVNEGFKVVKLGDIIKYLDKSKRKAGDAEENGIYCFYSSSDTIKKYNFVDYNEDQCLIIGTGDKCSLFLDNIFSCSADNFICITDSIDLTTYVYYYLKSNWNDFLKKLLNGSTMGHISKERLNEYEIPIPEDINTIKIYLDYLSPANETLQTQKEKTNCGMIKMLTMFGKEGVEWNEYTFDKLTEFQKKSIKYKAADGKEKGKYKFYTSSQDKIMFIDDEHMFKEEMLIMGKNGKASTHFDINFSCEHDHVYVIKCKNEIVFTRYMYYYIKSELEWYEMNMNGSTIAGTSKEFLNKQKICVLNPHMITKYKLQDEFDFMDKLKADIARTFKNQEEITKQMMKFVLSDDTSNPNDLKDNLGEKNTINSTKSTKSTKSTRPVEKDLDTESESDTNSNTNSESDSDSDDEDAQLKKFNIEKQDLIELKSMKTKDCSTHYYHPNSNSIYSFDYKNHKWSKGKQCLMNDYSTEIDEIIKK